MIKRLDASPVAMSLGDVLTALQQGALDGALGSIPVFGPMHYVDAAKYDTEIGQPYVNTIVVMNKKWLEALAARPAKDRARRRGGGFHRDYPIHYRFLRRAA